MLPVWIVLILLPILGGAERFNCRGRILGAYYADIKSGCKAFHVCVKVAGGGIRDFRFFCPPGTLFHTEAQTCTDWGDDGDLACPADLYNADGQFDLYKIGSGYDTKKLSSPGNREEEPEFGLQRAETGDRRSQNYANNNDNNAASNGPVSDLRAAHSSDFFSGQRDRGRDDLAPPARPAPSQPSRQSFRRVTTPRTPPTTTQYTTPPPPPPSIPSNPSHHEGGSKRKLVRKRPIYVSTAAPSTFTQNTQSQQSISQQPFSQQPFSQQPFSKQPFSQQQFSKQPKQNYNQRTPTQNKETVSPPANVPPQYKDEYVEVSRVTPKQNRYFPSNPTSSSSFSQSTTAPQFNKKDGLVELYNYDAQSTPGLNVQNENRPFKVQNSFSVSDISREPEFARTNVNINSNSGRGTTTEDYNTAPSRGFATSTAAYKNFNSVSYESEKNKFIPFSGPKQDYFNSPTTTQSTTTTYTTPRDSAANLNTIAYNTNLAFNNIQQSNYADSGEDDGQYRPPDGEDDGQYRPELYERERGRDRDRERDRELLSGAHSLNIAASGNRLPEDQKPHRNLQPHQKPVAQTSAPRPFRPAPTQSAAPAQTTLAPEPTYTTTYRPPTTANTQRTFDYFQTYTTTSRPRETAAPAQVSYDFPAVNDASARPASTPTRPASTPPRFASTSAPHSSEPRAPSRASASPSPAPTRPTARPPHLASPASNKEDASYDYAYYDSDTGFSEFDNVEEFSKTKARV